MRSGATQAVLLALAACGCRSTPTTVADNPDATVNPWPPTAFCALPGSVVTTASGQTVVAGGDAAPPDLAWLKLPAGFCAHEFATVPKPRQLRFAPGGDLFVASPSTGTVGGGSTGLGAIVVLPDDDHDGLADTALPFLEGLPTTQGLMFTGGSFYYQDGVTIRRVPFHAGDRAPSGPGDTATTVTAPQAAEHWPKVLDVARDGTIFVTNGSTQTETCQSSRPTFGAIFQLHADGSTTEVARGFRNPIALRCEASHDVCLALELGLDYSADQGGREKLVPVRQGDDWGFPCCATQNLGFRGVVYKDTGNAPDCSGVATESASFIIRDTPFGLDFEPGIWPAPWTGRVLVTLHGDHTTWAGARVVAIALDPATGLPVPSTDLDGDGGAPGAMLDFATGWDDGKLDHGRPASMAFAPDGRLFLGDDQRGVVVWIAPVGMTPP